MVATIIEIGRHITPFFLMLQLILIAFSHAMVVVLGQPFREDSWGDQMYLISHNNTSNFNSIFSSLKYTYYLLTSDGDAYNQWDGVPSTDGLRILFLIFTAIIVLNVLIALMSNIVSKVDSEGRQRWLKVLWFDAFIFMTTHPTVLIEFLFYRIGLIVLLRLSCTGWSVVGTTSIFQNSCTMLLKCLRRFSGRCAQGRRPNWRRISWFSNAYPCEI